MLLQLTNHVQLRILVLTATPYSEDDSVDVEVNVFQLVFYYQYKGDTHVINGL